MELVGVRRLINALVLIAVTTKVTAGAKSFGSFFSGVANKAGAKIKETVKDNVSLLFGIITKKLEHFPHS